MTLKKALLASAVALLTQSAFALTPPSISTLGAGGTTTGSLILDNFDPIPGVSGGDFAYDVNRFYLGKQLSGTYELSFTSSVDGWSNPRNTASMAFGAATSKVDELYSGLGLNNDGSLFSHQELTLGEAGKTLFIAQAGVDYYAYVYGIAGPGQGAGFGNYGLKLTQVSAVPEPTSYALMLGGLAALGFIGRRNKRG